MEKGLSNEEQLSIYLKMDLKNETKRTVSKILHKIIEDDPIDIQRKKWNCWDTLERLIARE